MISDFYVAASAVIPILGLAVVVQEPVTLPPGTSTNVVRLAKAGQFVPLVIGGFVAIWAEVVCLRSLETGTKCLGGPPVVWVALGLLMAWIVAQRGAAILFPLNK